MKKTSPAKSKRSKYNARKIRICPKCNCGIINMLNDNFCRCMDCRHEFPKVDAIKFDSTKEYNYFLKLNSMVAHGEIDSFQHQVRFDLLPSQDGERPVFYKADFVTYKDGKRIDVIDVKGMRLSDYILKRKMMLFFHGIKIKEAQ